jgi:Flp pilus assembly protein TadD
MKEILTLLEDATKALQQGELDNALALAGKAVQLAPDDHDALQLLGITQLDCQQPEFSLVPLRKAYRLLDTDPFTAFALSIALQKNGRMSEALATARHAVQLAVGKAGLEQTPDWVALNVRGTHPSARQTQA